jgi:hypothetical protein
MCTCRRLACQWTGETIYFHVMQGSSFISHPLQAICGVLVSPTQMAVGSSPLDISDKTQPHACCAHLMSPHILQSRASYTRCILTVSIRLQQRTARRQSPTPSGHVSWCRWQPSSLHAPCPEHCERRSKCAPTNSNSSPQHTL